MKMKKRKQPVFSKNVISGFFGDGIVSTIKEKFPEQTKPAMIRNLKRNWYFPISAMAFFCLSADNTAGYFLGIPIAVVCMIFMSMQVKSFQEYAAADPVGKKIMCALSTVGTVLGSQQHFVGEILKLAQSDTFNQVFWLISLVGAVVSLPIIYIALSFFWKCFSEVLGNLKLFHDIRNYEKVIYAALLLGSVLLVIFSFSQSNAFYGTVQDFDIIYTSDSSYLVKGNVYLALAHTENDLRQPLFALFAAPFLGLPHLAGELFGETVQVILVNCVQLVMLFAANFILAKMMNLAPAKRVCFMLLTSCTYTQLLFTLMMEQYIVAYFWLILCVYLIANRQYFHKIALWGAGGTLLTSMVMLPFMSSENPVRNTRAWLADVIKLGLEFVLLLLVCCRFDVIFNALFLISSYGGFSGEKVLFADKLYQYIAFISSCFIAPDAGVVATADYVSWQLRAVNSINCTGVILMVLAVISAIWNRDQKSSLLATGWAVFSAVILLGLGWGTHENGLILYALYFGWAFLVLLYQLVEKIERKLNFTFLLPVLTVVTAAIMLVVNIPAIIEMVDFAIAYYPI